MHPFLEHLSLFTWMDIIASKERCIAFLQGMELIPKMHDYYAPECPKCSGPMTVSSERHYILGWRWVCQNFRKRENPCPGLINPLDGTFFEGLKLPLVDVFALMFGYILKINYRDMKDHIDCWRSRRKGREISGNTIMNFYSRFDEVILYALNKEGETFEKHGKIDRKKLWKKYIKTLNAEPFFRNIVFQLLMDIKSKYPCSKRKVIQTDVDLSSSVGATDVSLSAKNISSNETASNASNSIVSKTSNSTVSNVSNLTILSASNSNTLSASNSTVFNSSNSAVSSLSTSSVSDLSTTTVSKVLTSTISPVLNSSTVSVKNAMIRSDIKPPNVCVSNNVQSANIDVSKNSNLASCTNISEKIGFNENTNTTIENILALNNISPSTVPSFCDNSISNSSPSNVIIDSIFHDHEIMDVGMDIDHDEIITTTYNDD